MLIKAIVKYVTSTLFSVALAFSAATQYFGLVFYMGQYWIQNNRKCYHNALRVTHVGVGDNQF